MELRQLKYFMKPRLLNFTEAAKTLNISRSTSSQQIKQLVVINFYELLTGFKFTSVFPDTEVRMPFQSFLFCGF